MDEYSALDDVMTALADPTRRAILARLAASDARVTDVAAPFAISLNSVSWSGPIWCAAANWAASTCWR